MLVQFLMGKNVVRSKREARINNIYEVGKYFRDNNSISITRTSQVIFKERSLVVGDSVVGFASC
jgi:hypothetical protein